MKAEPVKDLPPIDARDSIEWGYEPKIDGHRLQIHKDGNTIKIRTRNDLDPRINVSLVEAQVRAITARQVIIDGEGAALDENGRTSWQALQRRNSPVVFFAFDLLYCDGTILLARPLRERQARLTEVISETELQLCIALPGTLAAITRTVKRMGFEGIIAKNQNSGYQPDRRSFDWQKKVFEIKQEFVIGGYRPEANDRVDSLLIGVYEGSELMFASKLRAGLNQTNRGALRKVLQPLNSAQCPFANLPNSTKRTKTSWDSSGVSEEEMDQFQWVRPKLLAEVAFRHWTEGGLLRHPSFLRLRNDKPAREVVRET